MKRLLFVGLMCGVAATAQPRVVNGNVAPGQGTVASFVANQTEPAWVGYSIPAVEGTGRSCCWYNDYNGCLLEPRDTNLPAGARAGAIALESPKTVNVLFRVENKHVLRIRTFAPDCELEAGGLTITWLNKVSQAESVKYLESLLTDTSMDTARDRERLRGGALDAISITRDSSAEALLEKIATDKTSPFQRQAMNGLARRPEAIGFLSNLAKTNPDVLGVLADRAGVKAIPVIQQSLQKEPQKAIQAMARLPKEEGVPLLIQAAKDTSNPIARKEAVKQLTRSKDPRALQYLESLLQ
jgi:hypothetical protein